MPSNVLSFGPHKSEQAIQYEQIRNRGIGCGDLRLAVSENIEDRTNCAYSRWVYSRVSQRGGGCAGPAYGRRSGSLAVADWTEDLGRVIGI